MRVVIAGGSGFIGQALTRRLVQEGAEVVIITRSLAGKRDRPGVTHVVWDARDVDGWTASLEGADVLVNLAGESIASGYWTAARKKKILESRLLAGQACRHALAKVSRPPGCLVQASAVGYYGDRGEEIIDEDAPPGRGFLAEVARQWEPSTAEAEARGIRRVIIRSAVVFGRGGGVLEKMLPPFRAFLGGPAGPGTQYFPWIHMDDEVGAIRFLMDNAQASGAFNLAAPGAVTMNELAATLGRVLGRPAAMRVPASALRIALGEMADELLLSGAHVVPKRLGELGYRFAFPGLQAALENLLKEKGNA